MEIIIILLGVCIIFLMIKNYKYFDYEEKYRKIFNEKVLADLKISNLLNQIKEL